MGLPLSTHWIMVRPASLVLTERFELGIKYDFATVSIHCCGPSADSSLTHFVGPDLEALQRVGAKGAADGHIGGIAAPGDQHSADTRQVVASIEGVPMTPQVGLKPGGEIHRGWGGGMPISLR